MSNLGDVKEKVYTVILDKERHIKFDLNSFVELEEKFGDIDKAFEAMAKGTMKSIRTMLWAGLVHEDEKLTERQAAALVNFDNLDEVMDKIRLATGASLPSQKSSSTLNRKMKRGMKKAEKTEKTAAGTGQD